MTPDERLKGGREDRETRKGQVCYRRNEQKDASCTASGPRRKKRGVGVYEKMPSEKEEMRQNSAAQVWADKP